MARGCLIADIMLLFLAFSLAQGLTLPPGTGEVIRSGRIAVVDGFVTGGLLERLKRDARDLQGEDLFTPDALAAYGAKKDGNMFDPRRDRTVFPSYIPSKKSQGPFLDKNLGDWEARGMLHDRIEDLRLALADELGRPGLGQPKVPWLTLTSSALKPRHELSYTRFGPGAYLKRHNDERHEELKHVAGWSAPTRRSVSWLVYLQDDDWSEGDGGSLRTYERIAQPPSGEVGARNGDLQLGWLSAVADDPFDRPVFLDARRKGEHGKCALFTEDERGIRLYISKDFDSDPLLFLTTDAFINFLNFGTMRNRFRYLEPPKNELLTRLTGNDNPLRPAHKGEKVRDILPLGGRLVLFDSVCLPHEVMASTKRSRFAASGWYHEDQQPIL